jgi:hypothetical protein
MPGGIYSHFKGLRLGAAAGGAIRPTRPSRAAVCPPSIRDQFSLHKSYSSPLALFRVCFALTPAKTKNNRGADPEDTSWRTP